MSTPLQQALKQAQSVQLMARFAGRADLERELAATAAYAQASGPAIAVVVGEPRRGKTALVNALAGRPGLLPAGTATSACVVVSRGPSAARVQVSGDWVDVAPEELAGWLTGRLGQARLAVVSVPDARLDGLTLVDTPGVGGLERSHRRLTLDAAERADAVVLVLDAAQELLAHEAQLLAAVTRRADAIFVAIARAASVPGAAEVIERNRERLGAAVAHARVFPVDSVLATQAAAEADAELARELAAESGIDVLRDALREAAGRIDVLRGSVLAKLTAAVTRELVAADRLTLSTRSSTDEAVAAEYERAKRERSQFSRTRRRAGHDLNHGFASLEGDLALELDRGLDAVGRDLEHRIAAGRLAEVDGELLAQRRALAERLSEQLAASIATLREELSAVDPAVDGHAAAVPVADAPPRPAMRRGGHSRFMRAALPAGMSMRVGMVVAGPLGAAIGAAAGAALGGKALLEQNHEEAQRMALARLKDVLAVDRREMGGMIRRAVRDARHELTLELDEALDAREEALARLVQARQRRQEATAAEQKRLEQALDGRRRQLEAFERQALELVSAARSPGALTTQ